GWRINLRCACPSREAGLGGRVATRLQSQAVPHPLSGVVLPGWPCCQGHRGNLYPRAFTFCRARPGAGGYWPRGGYHLDLSLALLKSEASAAWLEIQYQPMVDHCQQPVVDNLSGG